MILRRPKRKQSREEDLIQRAVVQHIKARGAKGLVWFAIPMGGVRSPIEAAIMKGLGVQAGVSDLFFLNNGIAYFLELKRIGGRPTEAQMAFRDAVNEAGGYAVVAEGLDIALEILETWGLLRGTVT